MKCGAFFKLVAIGYVSGVTYVHFGAFRKSFNFQELRMQQSLNGNLVVDNKTVSISREADFADFKRFAAPLEQFKAVESLKTLCNTFGERRTPVMDLYRQRLGQMRSHLRLQ
jgi:hypothetical protein